MHIGGEGSADKLATAVRKVWDGVEIRAGNHNQRQRSAAHRLLLQTRLLAKPLKTFSAPRDKRPMACSKLSLVARQK